MLKRNGLCGYTVCVGVFSVYKLTKGAFTKVADGKYTICVCLLYMLMLGHCRQAGYAVVRLGFTITVALFKLLNHVQCLFLIYVASVMLFILELAVGWLMVEQSATVKGWSGKWSGFMEGTV